MKSAAPNLIETNALQLTAALLVAFALAFFVYYGIDTMRDPVFAIDFSPYYVAGQLLAEGRAAELIPLPTDGLMTSSSPPFVANFQRYFFPDSKSGTGWIYLPGYAWLFRPLAGLEFPVAARLWLLINALLSAGAVALIAWARAVAGGCALPPVAAGVDHLLRPDLPAGAGQHVAWQHVGADSVRLLPELSAAAARP
jgi:hypothetical protein